MIKTRRCDSYSIKAHLRTLQIPPHQPEAQEQVFGPTHFPLFMHIGSHTPTHKHARVIQDGQNNLSRNGFAFLVTETLDNMNLKTVVINQALRQK